MVGDLFSKNLQPRMSHCHAKFASNYAKIGDTIHLIASQQKTNDVCFVKLFRRLIDKEAVLKVDKRWVV